MDALNHKPNTKITWSRSGDSDTGSISFISGQEYQAGNEIFNNYGPKVNYKKKKKKTMSYILITIYCCSLMRSVSFL